MVEQGEWRLHREEGASPRRKTFGLKLIMRFPGDWTTKLWATMEQLFL